MDIIGAVIAGVILIVSMVVVYKSGYDIGKHKERRHLLNILSSIPPLPELKNGSIAEYDVKYSSLYVVDYIIQKMREE